jgi:hypothetical protein
MPDVADKRQKGEKRMSQCKPTSDRCPKDTVTPLAGEGSKGEDLTKLSLSSKALDQRGSLEGLLAQNAAAERCRNAPSLYAEPRVSSTKGNVCTDFSGLVHKKDWKGLEKRWHTSNDKDGASGTKESNMPKPVLCDAVAVKHWSRSKKPTFGWVGANVVMEQKLVRT